jgi:glycine betaine transporter
VVFLLALALSSLGKKRLGSTNDRPEHSFWSWIAMLYSAGMGAGILLRAVQEPVYMYQNPPFEPRTDTQILALEFTFYQWGITAWAFYGLFALVIGHLLFVDKAPVRLSESLALGSHNPWFKNGIDILTILTTIFGLIAAVGLGSAQISGGLEHLYQTELPNGFMMGSASVLVVLAFISAWQGLEKGIKLISKLNIILTLGIWIYVFFNTAMGPTLSYFLTATLHYLIDFIPMSLAWGEFDPGIDFLTDWTFYYWAFWLAWAPFTGIFIARISRGRTLRQLLLGVLLVPSIGTFVWFSTFGGHAFELIESWGAYSGEFDNVFNSIFVFFEYLPASSFLNIITLMVLIGFLVTSLDSAIFVLSMFSDGGKLVPQKKHRLLWALIIWVATLALLVLSEVRPEGNVLVSVQKILIITSLPFAFLMIPMGYIFVKRLRKK